MEEEPVNGGEGINIIAEQLDSLKIHIDTLEKQQREAVDSILNCDEGMQALIYMLADELKEYVDTKIQKLDGAIVACLQQGDRKWEVEMKRR